MNRAADFMARFRGVPTFQVATAVSVLTPGVNWVGCGKQHIADEWDTTDGKKAGYASLQRLTLDQIAAKLRGSARGARAAKKAKKLTQAEKVAAVEARRAEERSRRLRDAAPELAAVLREVADYWAGGGCPQELADKINSVLAKAGAA